MRPLLLKNLCLSSLLVLMFQACAPTFGYTYRGKTMVTEREVTPIIPHDGSLLFKARIKVYNKHYSGLMLMKQLSPEKAHLTFVTEIGMKMFDFEIRDTSFQLVYIFEPLNKPTLVKLLTADMKLILLKNFLNQEAKAYTRNTRELFRISKENSTYYQVDTTSLLLEKSVMKGALFTKTQVSYAYNQKKEANHIFLKHKGWIRVTIEMNQISGASKTN